MVELELVVVLGVGGFELVFEGGALELVAGGFVSVFCGAEVELLEVVLEFVVASVVLELVALVVGRLIGLTETGGFGVAVTVGLVWLLESANGSSDGGLIGLFGLPVNGLSFEGFVVLLEVDGFVLLEVLGFEALLGAGGFELLEVEGFVPVSRFDFVPVPEVELEVGITNDCPIFTSGVLNLFASRIALTLTPYCLAMAKSVSLAATT